MVYRTLEEKVGRSMPITNQLSWMIVRRMDLDIDGVNTEKLYLKAKCNTMVVLAAKVMEESFKLIVDRQTRANMVESVVYNCGLPSPKIAEIPFIATTEAWRNKGMCKLLLAAIETALAEMGAEHMLYHLQKNWLRIGRKKFRFKPLDEAMKREIIELNTLMFPRTTRLQKEVKPQKLEVLVKRLEMKRQREEIKAQKLKIKAQNQQLKEEIKAQKKVRAPRRVQQKIQVPVRIMLPDLNLPATE
ncbi:Increased DNA methylation 1 [Bienertia sinuspersici]